MKTEKPREFWIDPTDDAGDEDLFFGDALKEHPNQGPLKWQSNLIHVIEKSAFETLQNDYFRLFQLNEQLRSDNTAHFRKILELQKENEQLRKNNKELLDQRFELMNKN